MTVHRWIREARQPAVLFVIAAVIPVAVLSWLGLRPEAGASDRRTLWLSDTSLLVIWQNSSDGFLKTR